MHPEGPQVGALVCNTDLLFIMKAGHPLGRGIREICFCMKKNCVIQLFI